jgi:phosphatidylserine/phosphatidylglycerophosphate/cardiolipin synthase-like enzyme
MPFADDPEQALSLAWYAQRKTLYTGGNQVQLLRGGQAWFPALIKAIEGAKQSIWLANYMVLPDGMPGACCRRWPRLPNAVCRCTW